MSDLESPERLERLFLRRLLTDPGFDRGTKILATRRFGSALGFEFDGNQLAELNTLMPSILAGQEIASESGLATDDIRQLRGILFAALNPQPVSASSRIWQLWSAGMLAHTLGDFPKAAEFGAQLRRLSEYDDSQPVLLLARALGTFLEGRFNVLRNILTGFVGLDAPEGWQPRGQFPRTPENIGYLGVLSGLALWVSGRVGIDDDRLTRGKELLEAIRTASLARGVSLVAVIAGQLSEALAREEASRPANQLRHVKLPHGLLDYFDRRFPHLWPSQVGAIQQGVIAAPSSVISLPTSAGKTLIAELRVANDIAENPAGLAIYMAPYNALARQVYRSFQEDLRDVSDVDVALWTGTYEIDSTWIDGSWDERKPRVMVMTPEKFDHVLRHSRETSRVGLFASSLLDRLSLIVFDEIHLLGRPDRGPKLELILMRIRARFPSLPMFAMSAALTNLRQVAGWLQLTDTFRDTWRPSESWEGVWRPDGRFVVRNGASFQGPDRPAVQYLAGARLASMVIDELHPVLLIVPDRQSAEKVARAVFERETERLELWRGRLGAEQRKALDAAVRQAEDTLGSEHAIAVQLRLGVAYHHAGVPGALRAIIEDLVRTGSIHTLAATTTLAEGIDLPFRVVIIPSLYFQRTPMSKDLYLNIAGRAGRAGFHAEGYVVIIESEASEHLRRQFWDERLQIEVVGQLGVVALKPTSIDAVRQRWEFESQVIGALGDGDNFAIDDQAHELVKRSFTGQSRTPRVVFQVQELVADRLEYLGHLGLAKAASPYALTALGRTVRLTGLSGLSGVRINTYLERPGVLTALGELGRVRRLRDDQCAAVARLLFEASEMFSGSLSVRLGSNLELLERWNELEIGPDEIESLVENDVEIMNRWIAGYELPSILPLAPKRQRGRFSGEDDSRLLDLVEHIGRLSEPSGWVWSGVLTMAAARVGVELTPETDLFRASWISKAAEYGLPSRTGIVLREFFDVPRERCEAAARLLLEEEMDVDNPETVVTFVSERLDELMARGFDSTVASRILEA